MNTYVMMPTEVRRQHTGTHTVVICGEPTRVAETVDPASLHGSDVQLLSTASAISEFADHHAPPESCLIVTPLPDGPVLPLIRMLRSRGWARIVVLSAKADARAVHSAALAGVRGVVVNPEADTGSRATGSDTPSVALSDRELEVLRMVADGQTNRLVGQQLGLSALTVKSHLARIARKLGCGDRAQMVAEAIRHGYID